VRKSQVLSLYEAKYVNTDHGIVNLKEYKANYLNTVTKRTTNRRILANSRNNKVANPPRGNKPRRARKESKMQMQSTNIPMTQAFQIRNSTRDMSHIEQAAEVIGSITIGPNIASGTVWEFTMDPTNLPGTRLEKLASTFQKFRFRSMRLCVASNFSTTVSGSIACGYAENPDQEFPAGALALNRVFACSNATIASLYTPLYVMGKVGDKSKWYNIDDDSDELMQTTQGKFVITLVSPVSLTASVSIPVTLEYSVEFLGRALQATVESTVSVFPAMDYTFLTGPSLLTLTPRAGEPPATIVVVALKPYRLQPAVQFTTSSGSVVAAGVIVNQGGSLWKVYETLNDVEENTPIADIVTPGVTTRSTIEAAF